MPDGKLFIGGEWKTGTGEEIVSIFPADGSLNCSFSELQEMMFWKL